MGLQAPMMVTRDGAQREKGAIRLSRFREKVFTFTLAIFPQGFSRCLTATHSKQTSQDKITMSQYGPTGVTKGHQIETIHPSISSADTFITYYGHFVAKIGPTYHLSTVGHPLVSRPGRSSI
jgi:hypothetical protein